MIFGSPKKEKDPGLTGSLKDFGLPDLFQILGQQQKTGILHLEEGKRLVQVLFDKGMIVGAGAPTGAIEDAPLGARLVRGNLLSREQWGKACQRQKEELTAIEQILVKGGTVPQEDITAVLRLITSETLYGLFKWTGGTFRFEAKPVFYDASTVEPLKTEYILFDLLRMVDEWPMLSGRIPHLGLVFQKTDPLAGLDSLAGTSFENQRSFQMEVIFGLIDGQRTVQEIMDQGFLGEFDTCKNLATLMDGGLIEPTTIQFRKELKKPATRGPLQTSLNAGALILIGVLGLFLIYQLAIVRGGSFPLTHEEARGRRIIQVAADKVRALKLQNAREVFQIEENRSPQSDSELTSKGLWP